MSTDPKVSLLSSGAFGRDLTRKIAVVRETESPFFFAGRMKLKDSNTAEITDHIE